MPTIGPMEIAIVVIVALLIFGPKRLPELGRSTGQSLREFKASISGDSAPTEATAVEEPAVKVKPGSTSDAKARPLL